MYDIKEIILTNNSIKKKRPIITFHDEKQAIVGEFLMTDAPLLRDDVLNVLQSVLNNEQIKANISGNRTHLHIMKNKTTITDLFDAIDGFSLYEQYTIETDSLYDLTKMWLERLKDY